MSSLFLGQDTFLLSLCKLGSSFVDEMASSPTFVILRGPSVGITTEWSFVQAALDSEALGPPAVYKSFPTPMGAVEFWLQHGGLAYQTLNCQIASTSEIVNTVLECAMNSLRTDGDYEYMNRHWPCIAAEIYRTSHRYQAALVPPSTSRSELIRTLTLRVNMLENAVAAYAMQTSAMLAQINLSLFSLGREVTSTNEMLMPVYGPGVRAMKQALGLSGADALTADSIADVGPDDVPPPPRICSECTHAPASAFVMQRYADDILMVPASRQPLAPAQPVVPDPPVDSPSEPVPAPTVTITDASSFYQQIRNADAPSSRPSWRPIAPMDPNVRDLMLEMATRLHPAASYSAGTSSS